ncbi:MAG: bifunctional 23S rRNA (guanine(2069)-N(7))-methyltransferase RlmK/23S rRNA (guanine(2445)-N(2))-methyltransferase RlmL [Eggerthellaceae bacterium]|nr:bifunctional 23S rRNA (guanine(2069)-N(7))-methyltransferase RlmK/23S rRNA (guanine(2445)-N(2))-methyltransferase RlmL [Eggerthellaceae bacterium]
MNANANECFARCASGFERVVAQELKDLGAKRVRPLKGGVSFFGTAEDAYRACLWSRAATRIQLVLVRAGASCADELYRNVRAFPWEEHVAVGATIAVHVHGQNGQLRNTQFTALKVKDALCDRLRDVRGTRPSVDSKDPDFAVDVSLFKDRATLYANLSGASLHRRGYRLSGVQGEAPLKETLAAGMLLAAGWGKAQALGNHSIRGFCDPMCGSGTLAIEAALMALDRAPGRLRDRWGFEGWAQHDQALWERLCAEADARANAHEGGIAPIVASDKDARAVDLARANAQRAGVADAIRFLVADAASLGGALAAMPEQGLMATNPPYGQRLLSRGELAGVYASLRAAAQDLPFAWDMAIITPDDSIDGALGETATQVIGCYNGPIEAGVRLYRDRSDRTRLALVSLGGRETSVSVAEANSAQFAARLRKAAKERAKWARREQVSCMRLYDADLPDYALSVDVYQEQGTDAGKGGAPPFAGAYVRVAEYQAPGHIDPLLADRRFNDALAIVPAVLDVDPSRVYSKVRKRAKGGGQYREARGDSKTVIVEEAGLSFEVDLGGYLDTGLFLDHRITRGMVGELSMGARFLNLFAYTGAASVHAAAGGAASTTTVDLSHTYLDWARRNMQRNGFEGPNHRFERADVRTWLKQAAAQSAVYDLVFCDPPTFSNSKATEDDFDVQRDHVELLKSILGVLAAGGKIVFSCNLRSFKPDEEALLGAGMLVHDITRDTIPHDFERSPKIHFCYEVTPLS